MSKELEEKECAYQVDASNVEQLLACINCKNSSAFEICGVLVDDWQSNIHSLSADGPKKGLYNCNTQVIKAVNNLIDTLEGLSAADEKCNKAKLEPKLVNLKTKIGTEINNVVANYQQQKQIQQEFDQQKCNNAKFFYARDVKGVQQTIY